MITKSIKELLTGEFITYGFHIDTAKINPISDKVWPGLEKPKGGLWASPVNSVFGWKDWCRSEDFRTDRLKTWTKFKISPKAKILVINSYWDLVDIAKKYAEESPDNYNRVLKFKKMQEDGYSGVFLTYRGHLENHFVWDRESPISFALNTWDCESIVLFDPEVIEILEYSADFEYSEDLEKELVGTDN